MVAHRHYFLPLTTLRILMCVKSKKRLLNTLFLGASLIFGLPAMAEPSVQDLQEPVATAPIDAAALGKLQDTINKIETEITAQAHRQPEEDEYVQTPTVAVVEVVAKVIPIVIMFGGPLVLLAFIIFMGYRKQQMRMQQQIKVLDTLIAAGRDIPVELFHSSSQSKEKSPHYYLHLGLRHVFLGFGWLLAFSLLGNRDIGYLGLIVISLGASQLLIWKLTPSTLKQ